MPGNCLGIGIGPPSREGPLVKVVFGRRQNKRRGRAGENFDDGGSRLPHPRGAVVLQPRRIQDEPVRRTGMPVSPERASQSAR